MVSRNLEWANENDGFKMTALEIIIKNKSVKRISIGQENFLYFIVPECFKQIHYVKMYLQF